MDWTSASQVQHMPPICKQQPSVFVKLADVLIASAATLDALDAPPVVAHKLDKALKKLSAKLDKALKKLSAFNMASMELCPDQSVPILSVLQPGSQSDLSDVDQFRQWKPTLRTCMPSTTLLASSLASQDRARTRRCSPSHTARASNKENGNIDDRFHIPDELTSGSIFPPRGCAG